MEQLRAIIKEETLPEEAIADNDLRCTSKDS